MVTGRVLLYSLMRDYFGHRSANSVVRITHKRKGTQSVDRSAVRSVMGGKCQYLIIKMCLPPYGKLRLPPQASAKLRMFEKKRLG